LHWHKCHLLLLHLQHSNNQALLSTILILNLDLADALRLDVIMNYAWTIQTSSPAVDCSDLISIVTSLMVIVVDMDLEEVVIGS
jgi:hypothetical protein